MISTHFRLIIVIVMIIVIVIVMIIVIVIPLTASNFCKTAKTSRMLLLVARVERISS